MMLNCENCNTKMKPVYKRMSRMENMEFYRCPSCKLLWAPKLDVKTSFQSKLNEKNREKALKNIRTQEFEQVNRLIECYVEKGGRGLDVGCGYGWYLKSISRDYRMEGIEPEPVIAEKAREGEHMVYSGFFPKDLPDSIGKYDFIVFNNVWEHINYTAKLVEESSAYLRAGG